MKLKPLRAFGASLIINTFVILGILGSTESSQAAPGAAESSTVPKPTIVLYTAS